MKTTTLASECSRDAGVTGILYGVTAFGIWGLVPIYYKALGHVSLLEIVAHRVVWAMAAVFNLVFAKREDRLIFAELRDWRNLGFYLITTLLVGSNWLIFIWVMVCVRTGMVSLLNSALAISCPPHQVFSFGKYASSPEAGRLRLPR